MFVLCNEQPTPLLVCYTYFTCVCLAKCGWLDVQGIDAVHLCRWMYNRVLDKVLTVGRAATQSSATYNQLAQYVVSDSMFSTLICYLSFS